MLNNKERMEDVLKAGEEAQEALGQVSTSLDRVFSMRKVINYEALQKCTKKIGSGFAKKAVSVVTCAMLFCSSVGVSKLQAEDARQWFAIPYQNITPPSAGGNGMDGAYASGGSIEYRFSYENVDWSPIVDWEAPSIKAGCSSLSLNGGFASFLGLEDLAEQLANAGQALIWGILIALINSLPSLEHIFSKIKEIVNWVSSMLRNMCNMGKAIGNSMLQNSEWGKAYMGAMDTTQSFLNNLDSAIPTSLMNMSETELVDEITKAIKSSNSSTTGKEAETTKKEIAEKAKDLFIVGQLVSAVMNTIFDDADGEVYLPFQSIDITDSSDDQKIYLIIANILGDDSISKKTAMELLGGDAQGDEKAKLARVIPELVAKGKAEDASDQEVEALANKFANALKNNPSNSSMNFDNALPPTQSADEFITKLLNGGEFEIKKVKAIKAYANPSHDKGNNNQGKLYFLMPYEFGEKVKINWDGGLIKDSYVALRCKMGYTSCSSSDQTAVLLPDIQEKVETLKKYLATKVLKNSKGGNSPIQNMDEAVESTLQMLSNYNAYLYAKFMIMTFRDRIQSELNKSRNIDKKGDISQLQKKIELIDSWLAKLDDMTIKDQKLFEQVDSRLDRLQKLVDRANAKKTSK